MCAGSDGFAFDSFPFALALTCLSNAQMCHAQLEDEFHVEQCRQSSRFQLALLQSTTSKACTQLQAWFLPECTLPPAEPCQRTHTHETLVGKLHFSMEQGDFSFPPFACACSCGVKGIPSSRLGVRKHENVPRKTSIRKGKSIRSQANANKG